MDDLPTQVCRKDTAVARVFALSITLAGEFFRPFPTSTLAAMSEEARASNIIPFGPRSPGSAAARRAGSDPLSDRVAALETQLIALEANLTRERTLLAQLSESDAALNAAAWGTSDNARGQDADRNARALLERAISDRRQLADQVAVLRAERDALLGELSALRREATAPDAQNSPEQAKDEKLENVVGALRAAADGLVEEIEGPASVVNAPSAALHEDVDELPPPPSAVAAIVDENVPAPRIASLREAAPEPPKASEFGLVEQEDILATAEAPIQEMAKVDGTAAIEAPEPAASAPPTTSDASIAAMWDAVPVSVAPAVAPAEPAQARLEPPAVIVASAPIVIERASFITDEFILETSPFLRVRVVEAAPIIEPAVPEIELPSAPVETAEPVAPEPVIHQPVIEEPVTRSQPAPTMEIAEPVAPEPVIHQPVIEEPVIRSQPAPTAQAASSRIQLVVSPISSFVRLIEIQDRLGAVKSVRELQLRDYRNGVATFALSVAESIGAHEFGAVVQMLGFGLRLLGATQLKVELALEDDGASS
jgi:hypothetical protein